MYSFTNRVDAASPRRGRSSTAAYIAGCGAALAVIACTTSDAPPSTREQDAGFEASATDTGDADAGSRDASLSTPEVPDVSTPSDGGASGVGCPKTSCTTYAARSNGCDPSKELETWANICTNAAAKCKGTSIPDCFCAAASDCDALRWCSLSPCEQ